VGVNVERKQFGEETRRKFRTKFLELSNIKRNSTGHRFPRALLQIFGPVYDNLLHFQRSNLFNVSQGELMAYY
jgi:hypothetical protein